MTPGGGGLRPGGGGLNPGGGGLRPGGGGIPGGNGNRPGIVNRPTTGSGNIGSGNIGSGNTNNYFGGGGAGRGGGYYSNRNTNVVNNNVTRVNNTVVNNGFGGRGAWGGGGWGGGGWGGAGWGGGGWRGGGWGAGGWGRGGFGGGWASPFYGSWYRGGWGNSASFWTGFGIGAVSSFGLGSIYGGGGFGGWGAYGYPVAPMAYSYFPTWGVSTLGGWGLGSVANSMLLSGYTNPYYATAVAAQPAPTTIVYDYSQPINVTAAPPDASVTESTEQVFSAARDSFMAGDYQRALDLTDQVLKQTPNAAVVHEFRAMCLFALKRYDDAAAVAYAVLTAGPGWNWSTMVGLYPGVDPYTDQLRALEAYARANPNSTSARFLLGYHYMVQGNQEAAAGQFENVVKLQPDEKLSASFAKALRKATEPAPTAVVAAPTATQPAAAPAAQPAPAAVAVAATPGVPAPAQAEAAGAAATVVEAAEQPAPPPPPAQMAGLWKAQPAPDVSITLNLEADGKFSWEVDSKGQKQTLTGQAGFKDNELALFQPEGPPLIGKITQNDANKFVFAPTGSGDKAPGLTFTK